MSWNFLCFLENENWAAENAHNVMQDLAFNFAVRVKVELSLGCQDRIKLTNTFSSPAFLVENMYINFNMLYQREIFVVETFRLNSMFLLNSNPSLYDFVSAARAKQTQKHKGRCFNMVEEMRIQWNLNKFSSSLSLQEDVIRNAELFLFIAKDFLVNVRKKRDKKWETRFYIFLFRFGRKADFCKREKKLFAT